MLNFISTLNQIELVPDSQQIIINLHFSSFRPIIQDLNLQVMMHWFRPECLFIGWYIELTAYIFIIWVIPKFGIQSWSSKSLFVTWTWTRSQAQASIQCSNFKLTEGLSINAIDFLWMDPDSSRNDYTLTGQVKTANKAWLHCWFTHTLKVNIKFFVVFEQS